MFPCYLEFKRTKIQTIYRHLSLKIKVKDDILFCMFCFASFGVLGFVIRQRGLKVHPVDLHSPVNLGIFEAQHQTNCNRIVFNAI